MMSNRVDYPGRTSCGCPYLNQPDAAKHWRECHYRLNTERGVWQTKQVPAQDEREETMSDTLRCAYCDGTGDVHRPNGEWAGRCVCQSTQDEQEAFEAWYATPEALDAGNLNGWRGIAWAAWRSRATRPTQPAAARSARALPDKSADAPRPYLLLVHSLKQVVNPKNMVPLYASPVAQDGREHLEPE